jgi:hypothetical protein
MTTEKNIKIDEKMKKLLKNWDWFEEDGVGFFPYDPCHAEYKYKVVIDTEDREECIKTGPRPDMMATLYKHFERSEDMVIYKGDLEHALRAPREKWIFMKWLADDGEPEQESEPEPEETSQYWADDPYWVDNALLEV